MTLHVMAVSSDDDIEAPGPVFPQVCAAPAAGIEANDLFKSVYADLKDMAQRELRRSRGHTLDTTALVHELYVKVCTGSEPKFTKPAKFFAYAALAMRHILIDRAYRRVRIKLGGGETHVELTDPIVDGVMIDPQLALQLDAALTRLESIDARAARVVELHYFAGLSLEKVADLLGVVRRTVDRDWRYARAYLSSQVERDRT